MTTRPAPPAPRAPAVDLDQRLSPNFALRELVRSQAAARLRLDNTPSAAVVEALRGVCEMVLEPVRGFFGRPVFVNSGYRSPAVNAAIGGARTSQHARGEAVDFEVPGVSNFDVALWIERHLHIDQLILEHYERGRPSSGWVHCSWRAQGRRRQVLTKLTGEAGYRKGLVE